ncbi:MAG: adenylate kinase family protein [Candidatus Magasanikbacteria bacterium]
MKQIIILLGVPGSGKGTQAEKIAEKHDYEHISTGDLFRDLDKDSISEEDFNEIKKYMDQGRVVPDKYVYKLAFPKIQEALEEKDGVVLDGAIRTLDQAKSYQKFFRSQNLQEEVLALEIRVPEEEAIERLKERGETSGRDDDTEEIIKQRMKEQGQDALKPILNYYESLGVLETVDGDQPIEGVESSIEEVLGY